MTRKYRPKGLRFVRCAAGENELAAMEFQRYYRLPAVHVLDGDRAFEKQHNDNGWPFIMLVNSKGEVVYDGLKTIATQESQLIPAIEKLLAQTSTSGQPDMLNRDGVPYMPATLKRSGEVDRAKTRDRFPSLACAPDGRMHLVFTRCGEGGSDVLIRIFDGEKWAEDQPIAASEADEFDGRALVDTNGRVWVSWTSNANANHYRILITSFSEPSEIPAPEPLTPDGQDGMHARLALDAQERVWVTYYKWDAKVSSSRDPKDVYVRCYHSGRWSREVHVIPDDVPHREDHTDPAIAAYREGVAVCWSWDFHPPKGFTGKAKTPSIFLRAVDGDLKLGSVEIVSGSSIDTTPAIALDAKGQLWCAWDSLAKGTSSDAYCKRVCLRACEITSGSLPSWREQTGGGSNNTLICTADYCVPLADAPHQGDEAASAPTRNVCTPGFAKSPKGQLTLIWSECDANDHWDLKRSDLRSDLRSDSERWSPPQVLFSEGNPRFPSAVYDKGGSLWIAYSMETARGSEIVVRELPEG